MPSYNGTIKIVFEDGLASLTIDKGAARIPVGILDRWMRTKGVKLFRAQQMALSKPPVTSVATESPLPNRAPSEKPKLPHEAPAPESEAKPKTGTEGPKAKQSIIDKAKELSDKKPKREIPGPIPPEPVLAKTTEEQETERFMAGKVQPEQSHPEMDKIDAAIARAKSDPEVNSATEEKTNG